MTTYEPDGTDETYRIRFLRTAERESFLELYRPILGPATPEWFDWKYLENPAVSHLPILVAESESTGELAAARPQVPFRMLVDGEEVNGLRFGDTIVHEDHRRRGLFTKTTTEAMDYYRRNSYALAFNFPNDLWQAHLSYREFGAAYDPAVGFVTRNDFRRVEPRVAWRPRPAFPRRGRNSRVTDLLRERDIRNPYPRHRPPSTRNGKRKG